MGYRSLLSFIQLLGYIPCWFLFPKQLFCPAKNSYFPCFLFLTRFLLLDSFKHKDVTKTRSVSTLCAINLEAQVHDNETMMQ